MQQEFFTIKAEIFNEIRDYLEANKYFHSHPGIVTRFEKHPKALEIIGDKVKFYHHDSGVAGGLRGYFCYCIFDGIHTLTFFSWMLLLHINGLVSLKKFIWEVRKEDKRALPDVLQDLYNHFVPEELPIAY